MNTIDKNYLALQFQVKLYQKYAAEFQSFFEGIMQDAYPDFQKIRPYGEEGDGGNDGYRPNAGIYYQSYAPKDSSEKEAEAAKKFKNDFYRLKDNWDKITEIKQYNFVFNDKGFGISIELERVAGDLKKENPSIDFEVFTSKHLEQIFFSLSTDKMLSLGFDVDSRNALKNAHALLSELETELDRDNTELVLKTLENIKDIILEQHDENLILDYEIIESRALQRAERIKEAREKYQNIFRRYPKDIRAPLYLAEIYLNIDDFERNLEFLKAAAKIDNEYWLLHLEHLIRELRLGNKIDLTKLDEQAFPQEPRIRSNFYRIYSLVLEQSGDSTRADSFIERAIHDNPDRFINYNNKISILESRVFSNPKNNELSQDGLKNLLIEIEAIEQKFSSQGNLGSRNKALLSVKKQHVLFAMEKIHEFEIIVKETFTLVLKCYFDTSADMIITDSIQYIELPPTEFSKLLDYLQQSEKSISETLAKMIVLQFVRINILFTDGKRYFEKANKRDILEFINNVENKKYDEAFKFIQQDLAFAADFAQAINAPADFRKIIIERLPNDTGIIKEKLLLLLDFDKGNINNAFEILKKLDISKFTYLEARSVLKIAREIKAWDFLIILLNKLLLYEKEPRIVVQIKFELLMANLNLGKYPEVIHLGRMILSDPEATTSLGESDKEILLTNMVFAHIKRGEYPKAKELVEKYNQFLKTFKAMISVEVETYIANNDPNDALQSVIKAVKAVKRPSPEEYGSLFLVFIQIGNLMEFKLSSLDEIVNNCFVKLKNLDRWFFIGDGDELDATKITKGDESYSKFIGKKLGENIIFTNKYRAEQTDNKIENILSFEKYILWQTRYHATKLTTEQRWPNMELIEVPTTEKSVDTKYLAARLEDDLKDRGKIFDLYCQQNIPLALLSTNEGSLPNAMGRIVNETRGFIKGFIGTPEELKEQAKIAKQIISGQSFYIDGTSALMLSETGLIENIFKHLPNMKVPQSVINLLLDTRDKFRYTPGLSGYLGYSKGKIIYSPVDQGKRRLIQENFSKSITLLESRDENIGVISLANKSPGLSEQKILPCLSDACILAQKENLPVLTDDFLYLKMNELDTKNKAPKFCASLILIRTLYDQKKISFDQYLDFFFYLSTYRYKFLSISLSDLEKAVFGDINIAIIRTEQLRKFNFALTLSEEYGVQPQEAIRLVALFLIKIIIDDSILSSIAEKIFAEILSAFPTKNDRRKMGDLLLRVSAQTINKKYHNIILSDTVKRKIKVLSEYARTWSNNIPIILNY